MRHHEIRKVVVGIIVEVEGRATSTLKVDVVVVRVHHDVVDLVIESALIGGSGCRRKRRRSNGRPSRGGGPSL